MIRLRRLVRLSRAPCAAAACAASLLPLSCLSLASTFPISTPPICTHMRIRIKSSQESVCIVSLRDPFHSTFHQPRLAPAHTHAAACIPCSLFRNLCVSPGGAKCDSVPGMMPGLSTRKVSATLALLCSLCYARSATLTRKLLSAMLALHAATYPLAAVVVARTHIGGASACTIMMVSCIMCHASCSMYHVSCVGLQAIKAARIPATHRRRRRRRKGGGGRCTTPVFIDGHLQSRILLSSVDREKAECVAIAPVSSVSSCLASSALVWTERKPSVYQLRQC